MTKIITKKNGNKLVHRCGYRPKTIEKFTEEYILSKCIRVTENFLVLQDTYKEYKNCEHNNLPAGYAWIDIKDLVDDIIHIKNGQAATGNIKKRVTGFETRGAQVLIDVIQHEKFKIKNFDQTHNKQIERDYKHSYGYEVVEEKSTRTLENIKVPKSLLFEFRGHKRQSLSVMTNDKIKFSPYIQSPDHEICLEKLKNNTTQYFLLDCVMRFGKSYIYLEYIKREYHKRNKYKAHAVICNDTKTFNGWKQKVRRSYSDVIDIVILKNKKDFDFNNSGLTKNILVLISPQLVGHHNDVTEIVKDIDTTPISDLSKLDIQVENLFVDEAHNWFNEKWRKYYEKITKNQIILASGTAATILMAYKDFFSGDNVHTYQLGDLVKKLKEDLNIDVNLVIRRLNLEDVDKKINIRNLQDEDEHGRLVNPNEVDSFLKAFILGESKARKRFSPFHSVNNHFECLVDRVVFALVMKEFIKKNCVDSDGNPTLIPILVAGENKIRDAIEEENVQDIIDDAEQRGIKTITITCRSMIQGVSIRQWNEVINLSSVSTYTVYFQLLGRMLEFDDVKDYNIGKQNLIVWDYNPTRTLEVLTAAVQYRNYINNKGVKSALDYYFDIIKMEDYVTSRGAFEEIEVSSIETEVRTLINKHAFSRNALGARKISDTRPDVILEMDPMLAELFYNTETNKNTSKSMKEKLDSLRNNVKKQKTNYSKGTGSNNVNIQKPQVDYLDKVIAGYSVYTQRIDIVMEVLLGKGIIKERGIREMMKYYDHDLFVEGFEFPNKSYSKSFVDHLTKHGNLDIIDNRVQAGEFQLPDISKLFDMERVEVLNYMSNYETIYNYNTSDNQLPFDVALNYFEKNLDGLKLNTSLNIHGGYFKSGSLLIAFGYYLYKNKSDIFKSDVSKTDIIKMLSFSDEKIFFESIGELMGFTNSGKTHRKDFIIINPPYNKHIEIFIKSFDELSDGGTLICVHPSTPFINRKPTSDDKKTQRIKEIVSEYRTCLKLVDGNIIFDAGFLTPLSITRVQKIKDKNIEVIYSHINPDNKEVKVYDKLDDIFIHGNDIVIGIYNKIIPYIKTSIEDMLYRKGNTSKKYIKINRISGHPPKPGENIINPDFFQLIYKKNEKDFDGIITDNPIGKRGDGNNFNELIIKETDDVNHIHFYLMTKFARFCLSLYKNSVNILSDLQAVPYMDFSQKWTDEKLFEHFKLDPEERNFIKEYIPNWYEYEQVIK